MKTKQKDKVENDTQSYDHRMQRQENESECQVREGERRRRLFLQVANVWQMISSFFSRLRLPAKRSESQSSALSASIYQSQSLLFFATFSLLCLTVSIRRRHRRRRRSRGRQSIGFWLELQEIFSLPLPWTNWENDRLWTEVRKKWRLISLPSNVIAEKGH